MRNRRAHVESKWGLWLVAGLLFCALFLVAFGSAAEEPKSAHAAMLSGSAPENAADLKSMQAHLQELAAKAIPATVAVQVGPAQGSGVIVSADGYVLTAAHVVGRPGRRAMIVLHDGRLAEGETKGVFRAMDAGLVKITQDPSSRGFAQWPFAAMGDSTQLKPGQWCLATGHPGGFQSTGTPVVRVGRILSLNAESAITTDCTLIGGDSGGPLFDMLGQVVGIHSRIGGPLTLNLHVPVQTYRETWDRLVAGESWGFMPGQRPYIGVQGEPESESAKVAEVLPDTPAAKAGVQRGDVVTSLDGKQVTDFASLQALVESQEPGARVDLGILRGDKRLQLQLTIGRRRE